MSTPRRIDVDSTSILRRYMEDQISTNFHVISTYFFDVISLIEKSTSFPRTFFDVISMVEISTFFPRTFFNIILMFEKSTLFPRTFFNVISLVKKSTLFPLTSFDETSMGKKHSRRFPFVSNFKKLTFRRLFSLNFSSKAPWCNPVPLKFEYYNLQDCQKNCHKLVFWVFTDQLLYHIVFWTATLL